MRQDELPGPVLEWERRLLTAVTFAEWLAIAASPPATEPGDRVVSLLLADPTFELRHLAQGAAGTTAAGLPIAFVESLTGLAPQVAALHQAWRGEYRAVDHSLLFPVAGGWHHLLMLPLRRAGQLTGAYSVASREREAALAQVDPVLLEHVCAVLATTLDRHFERARLLRGGLVDAVTGWHSGHYLQARMREEIARCQRYGGSVACLVVDVDGLAAINEEFGQPAGDAALLELASRIESQVRASDAAARIGSDEFAVLLPGTDAARAVPLAERILAAVAVAPVDLGGGHSRVLRVSIGIAAQAPAALVDRKTYSDQLVANAMAALHQAKQRGGGGYAIAS
jgi:diguanylate cyclase (GGDEF)-like protein